MKSVLSVLASPRMLVVLALGFSSGIPLALTAATLQAWMVSLHVDLAVVGVFALVGLPYAFKFLWAPVFDRYLPPLPFRGLGRRRGWMISVQFCLIGSIVAMAFCDPAGAPVLMAAVTVLTAFFAASQDTLVDAYKTELLKLEEMGMAAGVYTMGYRLAMIASGAGSLILADHISWKSVYLIMSVLVGLGVVTVLLAQEPRFAAERPKTIAKAVIEPLAEFFSRRGAVETLLFMILYKLDYMMTVAMITAFMLEIGFTRTEIGAVTKAFGLVATIAGALVGGVLMVRMSLQRSLWVFGIAQMAAGLSFMWLAHVGHDYAVMATAVTVDNFCSGLAISAFSAFMMSLCDRRFTATQYALLASFMALARYIAAAPSGFLIKAVGWQAYFLISSFAGVPGLLLLTRFKRWSFPKNAI